MICDRDQTRIGEELSEIVRAAESFLDKIGNYSEISQKISGMIKSVDDATARQRDDVYAVSFEEVTAMKRNLVLLGVGALEMERGKEVCLVCVCVCVCVFLHVCMCICTYETLLFRLEIAILEIERGKEVCLVYVRVHVYACIYAHMRCCCFIWRLLYWKWEEYLNVYRRPCVYIHTLIHTYLPLKLTKCREA
jgi:hypothetical protein